MKHLLRETLVVCICEVLLLLIHLFSWLIILPCFELLGWFLWVSAFFDSVLDTVHFLSSSRFLEDCNSVCWVYVNSLMSVELFPDFRLGFAQECKRLSVVYFDESIFYWFHLVYCARINQGIVLNCPVFSRFS